MKNKVETLRAICYTADDMKNYTNLTEDFSDKEIEFMVEFKKIYELGKTQLEKFIDKLDEEGKDLDSYTIQYYIDVLTNGPLGTHVKKYSEDKKYFPKTPDILGTLGNKTKSPQNNTVLENTEYQLGCAVDTHNRLPNIMQTTMENAIKITENVFRSSLKSSVVNDNTLPIIDKKPQTRYEEEKDGKWVKRSNGSYLVKDRFFYLSIDDASEDIFNKVKETLGEETYRLYKDKKQYSAFDSEKNESSTSNTKYEKDFYEGDKKENIKLDILGDEFDTIEKRATKIKVTNDSKDKEYILNTNEGQLGN